MTAAVNPNQLKATAWTIVVHVLLLLVFFFWKYTLPAPQPVEDLGMEVNLGTDLDGLGEDQPMSVQTPSAGSVSASFRNAASVQADTRDLLRSDDPDAPAVAPTTGTGSRTDNARANRTTRNNNEAAAANSRQQARPRYVYEGATGAGGNNAAEDRPGTGEGNTSGPGDRGVPGGTPGSANYEGSPGNGTGGISHTLSGREISPRQFIAEFNQGGRVVVRVKVDRDGRIISKTVRSSPNRALSSIALQKLEEARFSPNPQAAPEQIGDITFVFKTRSR